MLSRDQPTAADEQIAETVCSWCSGTLDQRDQIWWAGVLEEGDLCDSCHQEYEDAR